MHDPLHIVWEFQLPFFWRACVNRRRTAPGWRTRSSPCYPEMLTETR